MPYPYVLAEMQANDKAAAGDVAVKSMAGDTHAAGGADPTWAGGLGGSGEGPTVSDGTGGGAGLAVMGATAEDGAVGSTAGGTWAEKPASSRS